MPNGTPRQTHNGSGWGIGILIIIIALIIIGWGRGGGGWWRDHTATGSAANNTANNTGPAGNPGMEKARPNNEAPPAH